MHDSSFMDGFHRFDHLLEIKTHEVVVHELRKTAFGAADVRLFNTLPNQSNSKTTKMSPSFGQTSASTICVDIILPSKTFQEFDFIDETIHGFFLFTL